MAQDMSDEEEIRTLPLSVLARDSRPANAPAMPPVCASLDTRVSEAVDGLGAG